jgi:hypothetical protein
MVDDWSSVEAEVDRIVAESDPPFTAETIAHVGDFLKYLRERTAAPKVGRGYWPTLNIWWEHAAATSPATTAQFEVFARKIEIYQFQGGHVEGIQEIPHVAGEPFPQEIEAALPI